MSVGGWKTEWMDGWSRSWGPWPAQIPTSCRFCVALRPKLEALIPPLHRGKNTHLTDNSSSLTLQDSRTTSWGCSCVVVCGDNYFWLLCDNFAASRPNPLCPRTPLCCIIWNFDKDARVTVCARRRLCLGH